MSDLTERIRLHSAGATVRHSSFEDMPAYSNGFELTNEFINTWVVPYYMQIGQPYSAEWLEQLKDAKKDISKEIVINLLGDFNWRTRHTGAYFAAIMGYADLIDIIGVHLLKSEVCYAGVTYAWVLAYFNDDKSTEYLERYLSYYLNKPNLWFDQSAAMQALAYLDKINQSNLLSKYLDDWNVFLKNKPHWNKQITTERIEQQLEIIMAVSRY